MEIQTFSYKIFVIIFIVLNYFQSCLAIPDDAQTQTTVQQNDGTSSSRIDMDKPSENEQVREEIDVKKCGVPNEMGLNKYGLEFLSSAHTKAGEFPWTVAILRKLNRDPRRETLLYSGAGALIHPSVVLTAANKHHTTKMDLIRAGEWDFSVIDEEHPYQDREIKSVQNIDENDTDSIQLIFVSEPFVLTQNVRTVCLPMTMTATTSSTTIASSTIPDTRECTTAAWGQQNCSGLKGLHSILGRQSISTDNKQPNACEADWQQYLEDNSFKLKNNQFCTKRKHNIDDSCFCDHGAALFCAIKSTTEDGIRYEQIGVSIASGGCTKDLPGIFSSIAEQREAIDEIFTEKGLDTSYYTA